MTVGEHDHNGYDWKISAGGYLSMTEGGTPEYRYWTGTFYWRTGMVDVYRQDSFTALRYVRGGRMYSRRWERSWHSRWIPRLCRKFVTDVERGDPYPHGR